MVLTNNALEALLSPASVPAEWPDTAADTLRPNVIDALPASSVAAFRAQRPWKAMLASGIAASVGLIWLVANSITSEPDTVAAIPMAAPPRTPAAVAPAAVVPAPTSEATRPQVTNSNSVGFADSFKSALLSSATPVPGSTADTIQVAVHISPPDAFVFKYGRRIGTGDVTVNVTPGTKTTLVAQLDGYRSRTLVLDGTNTSINIALSPAEASQVTDAQTPRAQKSIAAFPSSQSSESASKNAATTTGHTLSSSTRTSGSDPTKPRSSARNTRSDPFRNVDPL